MAPKARQAKGKARLAAYEKLLAEAKAADGRTDKLEITIPPGDRLGDVVIEAEHLTKGYGDRLLIDDLTFTLPPRRHRRRHRRQRRRQDHAVPHDHRQREARRRRAHASARPCSSPTSTSRATRSTPSAPSTRRSPTAPRSIKLGNREMNGRAYVAIFNFKGSDQQKKVGVLSGGERNRVHLAKVLKEGGNVLLLDEPTNDLDVDTLRALEDGLESFAGCAVVISHDRWFLDRVATHVLAFEGESQVRWFEGNFSEYEAFRHKELGADADQPHRIKYKPLVRGLGDRPCHPASVRRLVLARVRGRHRRDDRRLDPRQQRRRHHVRAGHRGRGPRPDPGHHGGAGRARSAGRGATASPGPTARRRPRRLDRPARRAATRPARWSRSRSSG